MTAPKPEPAAVLLRASAGAAFFDASGRILLVDPTYKPGWNLPGGAVDDGETPRAACVREVAEELGLPIYSEIRASVRSAIPISSQPSI